LRTAGAGLTDIRFLTRAGSQFDVTLASISTLSGVIDAINTAGAGKVNATIGANGNISLTDKTTGPKDKKFVASAFNGSKAVEDLGLNVPAEGGIISGRVLSLAGSRSNTAGVANRIERAINALIDPVSGVVPRQNKNLDSRSDQFKSRISSLDKLIAAKRLRLEKQFANMESVLAGLQDQQKAIGQIQTIKLG
jgi:flagellar capping protein FliD